jgi:hypothetical protein
MKFPINVWTEGGYVRLAVPAKTVTGQTTFLLAASEARELARALLVAAGGEDPLHESEARAAVAVARVVELSNESRTARDLLRKVRMSLMFDETTDARDCDLVNQITEFMGDGDGEVRPGRSDR